MRIEFCCESFRGFFECTVNGELDGYRMIIPRECSICPYCGAKIEITTKGEGNED